jgi:hypothetical protein
MAYSARVHFGVACPCKAVKAHRNVIKLSSNLTEAQLLASYSKWGDCLWVSTPASITAADLTDLQIATYRPARLSLLLHPTV